MNTTELVTEFLLSIRYARPEGDEYVESWKLMGRTILRRGTGLVNEAQGNPADFGSPVEVVNWPSASVEKFAKTLSPLVAEDEARRVFLVPTLREMHRALALTESNDLRVLCGIIGLDDRDMRIAGQVWATTARCPLHATRSPDHYPYVSEAEYVALRAAARQTDIEYVLALLDARVPVEAIIQLCALPPMPVEYAIAMAGGAA